MKKIVIRGVTAHPFPITSSNFMQLRETIQTLSAASINSREAEDSMVGNSHMMAGNSGGEVGERGPPGGSDILETQHQPYSSLLTTSHNYTSDTDGVLITAAVMSARPAASL